MLSKGAMLQNVAKQRVIVHVPVLRGHPYKFVLGTLSLHDCQYQMKDELTVGAT